MTQLGNSPGWLTVWLTWATWIQTPPRSLQDICGTKKCIWSKLLQCSKLFYHTGGYV